MDSENTAALVDSSSAAIANLLAEFKPDQLVVLGSGLGGVCTNVKLLREIRFDAIPGFAAPTVVGHAGQLLAGFWNATPVLVMLGRMHLYEGHPRDRVVLPIQVAKQLGIRRVLLTNMSGGIEPSWPPPALVVLDDHIDIQQGLPESRSPARTEFYCAAENEKLLKQADRLGIPLRRGTYAAVLGPNYETPAEIRAFRILGAHMVGMSTVPEALECRRLGLRCSAISCIANYAAGVTPAPIEHAEVIAAAAAIVPQLGQLLDAYFSLPTIGV